MSDDLRRRAALALCRILERRHPGTRWNVSPEPVHAWLDEEDYAVITEEGPPWREGLDDADTVGTDMSKLSTRPYSEPER